MACEWIMDGISFQKIYGLCVLKGHIVEIRGGGGSWTTDDGWMKECEDRAKILESRICKKISKICVFHQKANFEEEKNSSGTMNKLRNKLW